MNGIRNIVSYAKRFGSDLCNFDVTPDVVRAVRGASKRYRDRLAAEEEQAAKRQRIDGPKMTPTSTRIIEGLSIPNIKLNWRSRQDRRSPQRGRRRSLGGGELSRHHRDSADFEGVVRRRKEARKVAGFRDPLEEVGTLGASLKKPMA
ncbi:hypothetical protein HPB52_002784 [Rhipicephalus sanguineus]|uniref:Uncharacterized protein n=1 Tax=Rhipicephalus sanguineus TaxID=34632 RepID=A0A9D4Q8E1_RHISA|nr:hypothetical protein HPB52_002784 [Rhipicephalus sanguineus]